MKNKIPMNISIQTDQNIETPQGEPVSESVHTNAFGFLRETKNGMELEYLESKDKTFGDTVTTVSMLKAQKNLHEIQKILFNTQWTCTLLLL